MQRTSRDRRDADAIEPHPHRRGVGRRRLGRRANVEKPDRARAQSRRTCEVSSSSGVEPTMILRFAKRKVRRSASAMGFPSAPISQAIGLVDQQDASAVAAKVPGCLGGDDFERAPGEHAMRQKIPPGLALAGLT